MERFGYFQGLGVAVSKSPTLKTVSKSVPVSKSTSAKTVTTQTKSIAATAKPGTAKPVSVPVNPVVAQKSASQETKKSVTQVVSPKIISIPKSSSQQVPSSTIPKPVTMISSSQPSISIKSEVPQKIAVVSQSPIPIVSSAIISEKSIVSPISISDIPKPVTIISNIQQPSQQAIVPKQEASFISLKPVVPVIPKVIVPEIKPVVPVIPKVIVPEIKPNLPSSRSITFSPSDGPIVPKTLSVKIPSSDVASPITLTTQSAVTPSSVAPRQVSTVQGRVTATSQPRLPSVSTRSSDFVNLVGPSRLTTPVFSTQMQPDIAPLISNIAPVIVQTSATAPTVTSTVPVIQPIAQQAYSVTRPMASSIRQSSVPRLESKSPTTGARSNSSTRFNIPVENYEVIDVSGYKILSLKKDKQSQYLSDLNQWGADVDCVTGGLLDKARAFEKEAEIASIHEVSSTTQPCNSLKLWLESKIKQGFGIIVSDIQDIGSFLIASKTAYGASKFAEPTADGKISEGIAIVEPTGGWYFSGSEKKDSNFTKYLPYIGIGLLAVAGIYYATRSRSS